MSETISPTIERERQAPFGVEGPEIGQKTERRAYQVRDIWAELRDRKSRDGLGTISDEERDAGRTYMRHLELAFRGRQITPSYGMAWAEGTPLSQLAVNAEEMEAAREVNYYVLHQRARAALTMTQYNAIELAGTGHTLGQIGRRIMGYRSTHQANAAAFAIIKTGLENLVRHYATRHPPRR